MLTDEGIWCLIFEVDRNANSSNRTLVSMIVEHDSIDPGFWIDVEYSSADVVALLRNVTIPEDALLLSSSMPPIPIALSDLEKIRLPGAMGHSSSWIIVAGPLAPALATELDFRMRVSDVIASLDRVGYDSLLVTMVGEEDASGLLLCGEAFDEGALPATTSISATDLDVILDSSALKLTSNTLIADAKDAQPFVLELQPGSLFFWRQA